MVTCAWALVLHVGANRTHGVPSAQWFHHVGERVLLTLFSSVEIEIRNVRLLPSVLLAYCNKPYITGCQLTNISSETMPSTCFN
jgi:hypothetical protein